LAVVGVAAVSPCGAIPAISPSALGSPGDLVRLAPVSGILLAQTAAPVAVSIVEPPLKPPPTWTYEPKVVTVNVGTKVTWTNNGAVVHTVTADDGKTFESGNMAAKATFSFTPSARYFPVSLQTASLDEGDLDRSALGPRRDPRSRTIPGAWRAGAGRGKAIPRGRREIARRPVTFSKA